nr:bifunctional homocysteine S-methyltransferase/methylenetetrahydrofolate reductase [Bacillus velezensis]
MGLLQDLEERILIGDGAMGTLLYSYGIDRCFEELNVSKPEEIKRIHKAYVEAGADIIQTNTYGANFIKLSRYGLEDETKKINQEAVRIARASSDGAYVLGTMGGIRTFNKNAYSLEEIKRSFREQLYLLLHEEPDGLLLETYYDLEEAREVLKIARKETELPIMLNVSMHEQGVLQDGTPLREALRSIADLGADITGINCRLGPYHMIEALTEVPIFRDAYLSVYPNSSLPSLEEGRLVYDTDDAYFQESAVQFRTQGARIIGGCCGTTPNHIRAMAEAVRGLSPVTDKEVKIRREEEVISVRNERTEPGLNEIAAQKRSIIVELDPPKKLNFDKFLQAAAELKETGIEALTLADNSLATPRISNAACGSLLKERLDIRSLVHITCRDRNIIGLQSHLMGLDTLGLTDILAITGDPSKIGDFPGATSVYDLTSFDLIRLIKQFNEGISLSGKPLGKKTNFSVAGAFNPNVRHLDKAVKRLEKKIECGADYFVSQPVYSEQQLIDIHHETKHLKTPVYIGIMPLTSSRNAEFIHHEIRALSCQTASAKKWRSPAKTSESRKPKASPSPSRFSTRRANCLTEFI